jgi:hypothetical protein
MPTCQGHHWAQILTLPALAGSLVLGCSGGHGGSAQPAQSAQSAPQTPPTTTSTGSAEAPANGAIPNLTPASLTVADVDLYEKAAKARVDFLTQVKKDFDAAKTSQDSVKVVLRMGSAEPDSEAARAAGVTVAHELGVMRTMGDIIGTLHLQELQRLDRQTDTTHMDSASLAQVRPLLLQDRQRRDSTTKAVMGSMAPDVAAAFQQRRDNLDSLTFQQMTALAGTKKS